MEISEVRVKLVNNSQERLKAFCSITLENDFVIRDLKVIDGTNGTFVAMPSRKLSDRCPGCGYKSEAPGNRQDLSRSALGHVLGHEFGARLPNAFAQLVRADLYQPVEEGSCRRPVEARAGLTQMPALLAVTIFGLIVGAISNLAIERTPPIEGLEPPSLRNGVSLRVQFRRVVVTALAALLFALAWSRFGDSPIEFAAVAA
ncbi:MAG: septation protein SpoVG family protein, partial [Planctomycetes bacterium]|nr:septation protein SpoVG family protein [Planctomycetota bacterium]